MNKESDTVNKPKVISFINMKGGVGKTTLCINTADYLSNKGNKVIILDLDPQFNATQAMLLQKTRLSKYDEEKNNIDDESQEENDIIRAEADSAKYYEKLSDDEKTVMQIFAPTNANKDTKKDIIISYSENLDFVPGDLELSAVIAGDTAGKVGAIQDYIDNYLESNYDFVLIDCPPTWSILTHSSLYASNYYVIPSKIDFYSSIGINSLQNKIKEKLLDDSLYKATGKKLKNLGIIFSMTTGLKAEAAIRDIVERDFSNKIEIFAGEIPLIKSASSAFILYSEVEDNGLYSNLTNGFEKFATQFMERISQ
ncbi:ParA family protein [Loigolactobacillus binensis]|uniref:ParA family protein n=1 Tax=Loigolactobacillus binensis TaxID=2559922 RepID=A0ABW3ED76_9LACO|nr:AAA family ATPase [Loigolactobacillus binensis]